MPVPLPVQSAVSTASSKLVPDPLHHSVIRRHLATVNREISALDTRIENILLHKHREASSPLDYQKRFSKNSTVPTTPPIETFDVAGSVNSDTEHIYETIPDDNGDGAVSVSAEPIYCSPYKSDADLVELWLRMNQLRSAGSGGRSEMERSAATATLKPPFANKSSTSDDPDNSSSAYQTGGSCNSNTLTLELAGKRDNMVGQQGRVTSYVPTRQSGASNLVLYPPVPTPVTAHPTTTVTSQRHHRKGRFDQLPITAPVQQPGAATMYTNFANLQQTMRLQQRLFRQALSSRQQQQVSPGNKCGFESSNHHYRAPNLSKYQFVSSSQPVAKDALSSHPPEPPPSPTDLQQQQQQQRMEWKVKRRQDGSRYIVRRPVRTRRIEIVDSYSAAAANTTTEDDTISAVKITGRYWTRDDRRRHAEKSRDRRNDHAESGTTSFNKNCALTTSSGTNKNTSNLIQKRKPKKNSKEETEAQAGESAVATAGTITTITNVTATMTTNTDPSSSVPNSSIVVPAPAEKSIPSENSNCFAALPSPTQTKQLPPTVAALLSVTTV